jgi:penicillin-binding protein 2
MEPISSLDDPLDELDEQQPEEDDKGRPGYPRLIGLGVLIVIALVGLWVRLYALQIVHGADYRDQADNNRFREITIPAPRGVIYDRQHVVLARNRPAYTVGIVPADLPDPTLRTEVLARLASLLGVNVSDFNLGDVPNAASDFTFRTLRSNVPENLAFAVEERHRDLPGVQVRLLPIRDYPLGPAAAPILGYVGRISEAEYSRLKDDSIHRYAQDDFIGQTGIERTFESQLRGSPGEEQMEVDATGREVRSLNVTSPGPGENLTLTVDANLQQYISELLSSSLDRFQTASVVALDPRDGEVLALVHQPSYDNNLFSGGIAADDYQRLIQDPRHPLLDGAVAAAYPPGETFHVITALAGLQTGVITSTTSIDCPGFITVPNRFDPTVGTRLLDARTLGTQDVEAAVADACKVYFYQVGGGDPSGKMAGVGVEGLAHYAQLFGLGDPTGIDLVDEVGGLVPSVRWKRQTLNQEWVPIDTYQMAVGQGYMTATPLQMANVAAAIANGGTLFRPQIVLGMSADNSSQEPAFHPDVIRKLPIDPAYLDLVRKGMIDAFGSGKTATGATYDGASKLAAVEGWSGGGVAGSVEFGVPDAQGNLATHGWFIGFAPADHPTIALSVFLEKGSGPNDAARIAQQILAHYRQVQTASP